MTTPLLTRRALGDRGAGKGARLLGLARRVRPDAIHRLHVRRRRAVPGVLPVSLNILSGEEGREWGKDDERDGENMWNRASLTPRPDPVVDAAHSRLCAVFGGVYMLRTQPKALIAANNECKGLLLTSNERIFCPQVLLPARCVERGVGVCARCPLFPLSSHYVRRPLLQSSWCAPRARRCDFGWHARGPGRTGALVHAHLCRHGQCDGPRAALPRGAAHSRLGLLPGGLWCVLALLCAATALWPPLAHQ